MMPAASVTRSASVGATIGEFARMKDGNVSGAVGRT